MKKEARIFLLLVLCICVLSIVCLCVGLIREGLNYGVPVSELRFAKQSWRNGNFDKALLQILSALWMALDAGTRWSLAKTYISEIQTLVESGNLEQALKNCEAAVKIVHGYDDEGALSNRCFVIEDAIRRQNIPMP